MSESSVAAIALLEHAAVGAPITRAGVSLFPVYLAGAPVPPLVTGDPGAVEIAEAEAASVPTLQVTSRRPEPVLLVEGETVAGGLHQRTFNVSVLVPPGATLEVPVSCVEAGRWGGERRFSGSSGQTSRRVRRAKAAGVEASVRRGGHKGSDQGAVWASVDHELERLAVPAPTRNYADSQVVLDDDASLAAAVRDLLARGPLPGQAGVVVAHGSRVVAAEVFGSADLLGAQWGAIVRAAVLDAPDAPRGRPSASRALRFLRRLATGSAVEADGVGLGRERHVRTRRLVGQVLTLDDVVVHASAFALAA